METNYKKYKIRPNVDFKYYAVCALCFYLLMVLTILLFTHNISVFVSLVFFVFYCVLAFCFIVSLYLFYLFDEFIIDRDKISYINSFINYKQKDIKYEDIKEITLKQNFIQRWFELGIISMTTNASIEGAGIDFFNLKNPHEVYELIQARIAEHKKLQLK